MSSVPVQPSYPPVGGTRRTGEIMATILAFHEVDDVEHWLRSPKRQEIFGPLGITGRLFTRPCPDQPGGAGRGNPGRGGLPAAHAVGRGGRGHEIRWGPARDARVARGGFRAPLGRAPAPRAITPTPPATADALAPNTRIWTPTTVTELDPAAAPIGGSRSLSPAVPETSCR